MRQNQNNKAIDHIADTSAELAKLATNIGLESLVYILRMAEMEARQSIEPRIAPTGGSWAGLN
jgi:hypothetical protein